MWFDAPIGYISITACYTDEWEKWWKSGMGKDALPAMKEVLGFDAVEELSGEESLRKLQALDLFEWATKDFLSYSGITVGDSDPIGEALSFLLRSLASAPNSPILKYARVERKERR